MSVSTLISQTDCGQSRVLPDEVFSRLLHLPEHGVKKINEWEVVQDSSMTVFKKIKPKLNKKDFPHNGQLAEFIETFRL